MSRTSRRRAASAGLAVLLLSGCGAGQLRPGAAALVGDSRISTATLEQVVDDGLADPQAQQQLGADRAGFQRQVLSRLVKRQVLAVAAERRGVTVSDGDVAAQLALFVEGAGSREALEAQAAASGVSPEELDRFVRDLVLEQELGDDLVKDVEVPRAELESLYQQNIARYDRARSSHILVPDEATATRLLGEVKADPSRFAALAAEFSTDTSNKDRGGDLGLAPRGQFVPEFERVLFSLPEGGFGLAKTEFGFHVINVVERQTTSLAEATPELRRSALKEEIGTATSELLVSTADELGVKVNPRFGSWDAENAAVVAAEDPAGVLVQPSAEPEAPPLDPNAPADPGAPAQPDVPVDPNAPADPNTPVDPNTPTSAPAS